MDRDYRLPEDVARSSPDRVEQTLVRVLRQGVSGRPFLLRLRFDFRGGRTAPLLYIGNLNRAWNDYIASNARATDLMVGECTTRPRETGGTLIRLDVQRGRGATPGNLTAVNRWLRSLSAEIAYADDDEPAPAPATPPAPPPAVERATGGATGAAPDLAGDARAIRQKFEAFKAAPSAEGLGELNALIDSFEAALAEAPDQQGSKAAEFVAKLKAMLAAKGEAFVAKAGG